MTEILDFERLLAPISSARPTGVFLREDSKLRDQYFKIKGAADSSRTAERQMRIAERNDDGSLKSKIDPPNWNEVAKLCDDALSKHTKDLWIASWLIEALTRKHGFAGIRDGFRLVRELCERYWPDLNPPAEADDLADDTLTTVVQLSGLNGVDADGTLKVPILSIPITSTNDGALTSADYLQALEVEKLSSPEARERRLNDGAVSLATFETSARNTSPEFYNSLIEDIDQSLAEFDLMTSVLEEKCGQNEEGTPLAPPSSALRGLLEECRDRVRTIAIPVIGDGTAAGLDVSGDDDAGESAGSGGSGDAIRNREAAFRELLKIADFFQRSEPHSPISYALRQVVGWGRMSLPELLSELIDEETVRTALFRRTGIPNPTREATGQE